MDRIVSIIFITNYEYNFHDDYWDSVQLVSLLLYDTGLTEDFGDERLLEWWEVFGGRLVFEDVLPQ